MGIILFVVISKANILVVNMCGYYYVVQKLHTLHIVWYIFFHRTELTERHIKSRLNQFLSGTSDRLTFLRQLNDCWTHHCHQMKMVCNIFLALDRGYVLQNAQVSSIW